MSSRKAGVCYVAKSSFAAGSSYARLGLLVTGPYANSRHFAFMALLFLLVNCSVIALNAILCNRWILYFF